MGETDLIRIKKPTRELLEQLKIVDSESFDDVINRMLQTKIEEMVVLTEETKKQLDERINKVHNAQVFSSKELLSKVNEARKKRQAKEGTFDDVRNSER